MKFTSVFGNYVKTLLLGDIVDEDKVRASFLEASDTLEAGIEAVASMNYEKDQTECKAVEDLAQFLLLPLCQSVTLEKRKHESKALKEVGLDVNPIGIGSKLTWHGSPDCRAFPSNLNVISLEEEGEEDDNENEEDQAAGNEEEGSQAADSHFVNAKRKCNIRKDSDSIQAQVVATTIVASFIENNLNNNSMMPVLLMCKRRVRVYLYDCILCCSEEVQYPLAVYLVWVALHSRYTCR